MKHRNPTPAAVRAATALHGKWTGQGSEANWTVDAAAVIDKETGLPDLILSYRVMLDILKNSPVNVAYPKLGEQDFKRWNRNLARVTKGNP